MRYLLQRERIHVWTVCQLRWKWDRARLRFVPVCQRSISFVIAFFGHVAFGSSLGVSCSCVRERLREQLHGECEISWNMERSFEKNIYGKKLLDTHRMKTRSDKERKDWYFSVNHQRLLWNNSRSFYKTIPDMATICSRAHNMWRFQRSFLSSLSTFSAIEQKSQARRREWNLGGEEIDSNSRQIAKWESAELSSNAKYSFTSNLEHHFEHNAAEWDESGPHHNKSKVVISMCGFFCMIFFSVVGQTLVTSKDINISTIFPRITKRESTRTTPDKSTWQSLKQLRVSISFTIDNEWRFSVYSHFFLVKFFNYTYL